MWNYGYGAMMGGWGGGLGPIFCTLIGVVVLIDLILVGIWLWQQIKKN